MTSIIFMGTPNFCVPILQGLVEHGYDVKAVVTQPDKKTGRQQILTQPPAKKAAQKLGIPVLQPAKLKGSPELNRLITMNADLIITAAYGQFLPSKFLNSVKITAVNVHGSILPKYRGGAPIQRALMNGDQYTGVTIMEMVKKMDAGDIFAQRRLQIKPDDTAGTLFKKLSLLGRDLLLDTLPQIIAGTVRHRKQDPSKVVYSPTIKKAEERITTSMTASQANNLVRALNPDPGAYIELNGRRLKIWQSQVVQGSTKKEPGTLLSNKKKFTIAMSGGTILGLLQVQPAGKKRMTVLNFANGQGQKYRIGEQIVSPE